MARRKWKKALSVLLSAAMAVSIFSMNGGTMIARVYAEGNDWSGQKCENLVNCTVCEGTGETACEICGGEDPDCATCGGDGKVVCAACTEGKVPCTGTYELDLENSNATCMHSGTIVYTCNVCGNQEKVTGILDMHKDQWEETVVIPVTCTEDGVSNYDCPICGDTWENVTVKALGHEYDENGHCIHDGCDDTAVSVGATFEVNDCWEQYNGKFSFDTFSLICKILTSPENGEGTVAVTGWKGAEGNTKDTGVYILIPPTVTDSFGNEYTVTQVTANFQMNQSNQAKGKLLGFYLKAPEVKELTVNSMFLGQTNMKVLDLGNSLEKIGVGCFSGCKKIDTTYAVVLPETLKEIGIGAFKGVPFSNKNESTIDIPESVTYIGTGAFENSNLKTVTGGEGLTRLESTVFQKLQAAEDSGFPQCDGV